MRVTACLLTLTCLCSFAAAENEAPEGYRSLFNGKDLTGWHGMPHFNPDQLAAMSEEDRAAKMKEWNQSISEHWKVEDGAIVNDGHGAYLTTDDSFRDYELLIDYKTVPTADSGIYLKNTPQVQIWDHTHEPAFKHGSDKGSGALWNNSAGAPGKFPTKVMDKPFGEWNQFKIRQIGARTTVWLNGEKVVDNAIMENYWDKERKVPLRASGQIQLQTHGGEIQWRNIAIKEFTPKEAVKILAEERAEGFESIFNGKDLKGWSGPTENYEVVDGSIRCKEGKGGTLHTDKKYADFVASVQFKVPPGGNNGLAIRYPGKGNPAFDGMTELQVLDSEHPKYAKLDPRQYHGSAYGMAPAFRGYLYEPGEWNYQEVTVVGPEITVELNGNIILKTDLSKITDYMHKNKDPKVDTHPGKNLKEGYFGFAGHNDAVQFREVMIKELK
ncbi:3-keto-disaccharide hydrolase [Thalassoglobus polymorphus]|uniref:3-keto-alpha-glucoside-1,2-lyase/3-keto-2-hydroxy-glucal hydratase domain-containing protein n=1 Tax=Thalassoglobus polymorphus TaxID=2527994 RepID=A0A517QUI5_9PLAN|nr:DUF1080 domain-containing protein [Thalassoglobus polymorphus]QDT35300.1 hypothetical protein Mal48_45760 [Thalassoglobus polymorphus]